jgi:hypothetical protein
MNRQKKQNKQKKRQKKRVMSKQYRKENGKKFQLQVKNEDGEWVAPKKVVKNSQTEFFRSYKEVKEHLDDIEFLKKKNFKVIEGRILECETGKIFEHIEPYEPLSPEEFKEKQDTSNKPEMHSSGKAGVDGLLETDFLK